MRRNIGENYPRDAFEQALIVCEGWKEFKDELVVPNFSLKDFEQKVEDTKKEIELAEKIRLERSMAIDERNRVLKELWVLIKRVRSSAKASFGDDSEEVEKLGGKLVRFRKIYP